MTFGAALALGLTGLLAVPAGWGADAAEDGWETTLQRVSRGVVALHVRAPRPFDTEGASVSVATGFVVDAERGLILTNRHVVHPGPVVAEAVFLNHERIPVQPVYRDPVHDFGLFRYDPEALRFMVPAELPLAPEAAEVGTEIRVVGNDAGEKLSILSGTLARLDRDAPDYGRGRYNDFNTFYLQAASGSSGGSSGSPVVDREGRVVALNAGGRRGAASSFFLPLPRVVRALGRIRAGEPVTRGTIQTVFRHEPYDELRRLGLRPESEAAAREAFPDGVGLLVVEQVIPEGPAAGRLEPGDVLRRVEGRSVNGFVALEAALDARVGEEISLEVERGGEPHAVTLPVDDLHELAPSRYVELGGGIFHDLSLQMARGFGVPVRGVFVAWPGYAFARSDLPGRVVLTHLDGAPVHDVAELAERLRSVGDGTRMTVRYLRLPMPFVPETGVFTMDRRWFPLRDCRRDDASGRFRCHALGDPPAAPPPEPATTELRAAGAPPARRLARSLALVEFDVPLEVDGVQGRSFVGTGVVVDAERGLVLVDRDTVPIALGDVRLTFGGAVEVPGRLVALHPEHNMAVVGYDPALLGETPVEAATLSEDEPDPGEDVWMVTLSSSHRLRARRTHVTRVEPVDLPLPSVPRFREKNLELAFIADPDGGVGGVLADAEGRVRAFFASFSYDRGGRADGFFAGIPAARVAELIRPLREGAPLAWPTLGVEWSSLPLARARARGLPEDAAQALEAHDPLRRRALAVRRIVAGGPAAGKLRVGDLLVSADGRPVTRFRDIEAAAGGGATRLRIIRDGEPLERTVPARTLDGRGTRRVVLWAGALLQATPRSVAAQRGVAPQGVYVASRFAGTPAARHGLSPTLRIQRVDGQATPDLDAFLSVVAGREDRSAVRLRTVDLEGRVRARTLELDLLYWPTLEWVDDPEGGWTRREPEAEPRLPAVPAAS